MVPLSIRSTHRQLSVSIQRNEVRTGQFFQKSLNQRNTSMPSWTTRAFSFASDPRWQTMNTADCGNRISLMRSMTFTMTAPIRFVRPKPVSGNTVLYGRLFLAIMETEDGHRKRNVAFQETISYRNSDIINSRLHSLCTGTSELRKNGGNCPPCSESGDRIPSTACSPAWFRMNSL